MKSLYRIAALAGATLLAGMAPVWGETVDASDIPTNLRSAEVVQLTGTWDTQAFTDLAIALGTTGFMATNTSLTEVDMTEAAIEPGTSLYVSGGLTSNGVFVNCRALTTVLMPADEEAANFENLRQAFMNCAALTTINLAGCSGLTNLNSAFQYCESLTEIDLSGSTLLTGASAMSRTFSGCTSLAKVTLPETITFASKTFEDCTALAEIDWTSYAGTEAPVYYVGMFDGISDLKAITLTVNASVASLFMDDANWSQLTVNAVSGVAPVRDDRAVVFAGNVLRTQGVVTDAAVYSMTGAQVMSQKAVEGEWNVSSLPRGVYILSYVYAGQRHALKFVKR